MLQEDLEKKIRESYKEPIVIIMHPKTWFDLADEAGRKFCDFGGITPEFTYKGIRVIRSFDIEQGSFEVY